MKKKIVTRIMAMMMVAGTMFGTVNMTSFAAEATTAQTAQSQAIVKQALKADVVAKVFDATYYAEKNPDVVAVIGNDPAVLLQHYIDFGIYEGRDASATFNYTAYAFANPDLLQLFGNDMERFLEHYITTGKAENRVATTAALTEGVMTGAIIVDSDLLVSTGIMPSAEVQTDTIGNENKASIDGVVYNGVYMDIFTAACKAYTDAHPELASSSASTMEKSGILQVFGSWNKYMRAITENELKNGLTATVNGVQVHSMAEYDEVVNNNPERYFTPANDMIKEHGGNIDAASIWYMKEKGGSVEAGGVIYDYSNIDEYIAKYGDGSNSSSSSSSGSGSGYTYTSTITGETYTGSTANEVFQAATDAENAAIGAKLEAMVAEFAASQSSDSSDAASEAPTEDSSATETPSEVTE